LGRIIGGNPANKEVKQMNRIRGATTAAIVAGSMLIGGVAGAAIYAGSSIVASAATPSTTQSPGTAASPGTFKSNEDPAHEAGESPEREAQENAGQRPTVP
jgi:uncharacterized membrane protein